MPRVNPEILRWARETAGLTPEDAVDKLNLLPKQGLSAVARLKALELGDEIPSRAMLVKMAKHYRRPLLTFYLATPPRRGDRGQDFRTLPKDQSLADEALLDALIRDVQARQSIVRAVLEDEDEATPLPFVGSLAVANGVTSVVESIRDTLNVTLAEFHAQDNPHNAFGLLRGAAEEAGVFVLLRGDPASRSCLGREQLRENAACVFRAPYLYRDRYRDRDRNRGPNARVVRLENHQNGADFSQLATHCSSLSITIPIPIAISSTRYGTSGH